ncbi:outer membrane beta-barrel protein [Persicobacter psychrovividus]|uniref:Outer membrane protein beta-barrel domain-containing protein n=1 Tax=Persicobacter psychrovividus TaxID=387638 RepID=A0ABM7VBV7_9BACT|nr:hypothetical protein PEPS_06910 [Persicobacter psychrovividus]
MHSFNLWHKLYLHRNKVVFGLLLCLYLMPAQLFAQRANVHINLPHIDQKKLHYGFFISTGMSGFKLTTSPGLVSGTGIDVNGNSVPLDTVTSITTNRQLSLGVGFIANFKLFEALDLRVTPKAGFYDFGLQYTYVTDDAVGQPGDAPFRAHSDNIENVRFELPILLKLKSQRRGNVRAYFIGGVNPSVEVTGKKEKERSFEMNGFDMALELGFGFDLYYPLFRFSPEIRFSHGLVDMKGPNPNRPIATGIDRLSTNSITLYFNFQ